MKRKLIVLALVASAAFAARAAESTSAFGFRQPVTITGGTFIWTNAYSYAWRPHYFQFTFDTGVTNQVEVWAVIQSRSNQFASVVTTNDIGGVETNSVFTNLQVTAVTSSKVFSVGTTNVLSVTVAAANDVYVLPGDTIEGNFSFSGQTIDAFISGVR